MNDTNKIILVECQKCGKRYQVSEIEYKMVYCRGNILIETYCPFCGYANQEETGFKSSKGGKF